MKKKAVLLSILFLLSICVLNVNLHDISVHAVPPYSTSYWINSCDNLSGFNVLQHVPQFVVSLDNASKEEGVSSILMNQTTAYSFLGGISITNYTIGDTIPIWHTGGGDFPYLVYGGWAKMSLNYTANFWLWEGNSSKNFGFDVSPSGFFRGFLDESHGFVHTSDSMIVNDGEWHWFEVCVANWTISLPSIYYGYFIDGVSFDSFIGNYDLFYPQTFISAWIGGLPLRFGVDFLRVSDGEGVPSGAGSSVNVFLTSSPYNATFSSGGLSYDFPTTLSVSVGDSLTVSTELGRMNPLSLTNETGISYLFSSWTLNGTTNYSMDQTLSLTGITADTTIEAVYLPEPRLIEPNYNVGIGLLGLIFMFLSWFIGYWKVQADEYAEAFLYWLLLFGIGFGLFTVILGA